MKTLIINNGTNLLDKLSKIVSETKSIVEFNKLENVDTENFDLIILSGSSLFPVNGNENLFSKEIEFIKSTNKPIIGICFGFEIIIKAFDGTLKKLDVAERGTREVEILDANIINKSFVEVYENHKWTADILPDCFSVLAKSKSGPEIIKHNSKQIYGLQFHPENMTDITEGEYIFESLVNKLLRS